MSTGHTLLIEGLLLGLGGVLVAVLFALRLAEGVGPDQLSILDGAVDLRSTTGKERA